jgi:hypothetical protein
MLPDILRAEAKQGVRNSHKSVINVFLAGGPSHIDLWDLKTGAPSEIRGPFQPIKTSVPGLQICEVFPRLAKQMHHCAVIRSVVGAHGDHYAQQCMTGWHNDSLRSVGGRPSIGAVATKVLGPADPSIPPFVGLSGPMGHRPWSDSGTPGFLGPSYGAFKPDGPGLENLRLQGVTTNEFADRRKLLLSLDKMRRDIDASGMMTGMDVFNQRAMDVLTSSRLLEALDITKEPQAVRERYGDGKPYNFQADGGPTANDQLLIARRLVEVGVRCVTLTYGRWDSHSKNFDLIRDHGPKLDQGLSALIDDLDRRGLLQDTTVIVWGEFGRTPRINKDGGRDHWPQVSCALLAGGGIRAGQVIGATNRLGEYAKERPVDFQEIFATLYANLGIDPRTTVLEDPSGRPQYLLDKRQPIAELV